jgi:2'-hydroxyisoflavone reductase
VRILFLGGTRFLGRHAVDAALARGHAVTVFTRGRAPNPWGDAVTVLTGDRDPLIAPGLDALRTGNWDAVIDTSGYVPRVVRASAAMLHGRVAQYLFVSSISVYAGGGGAGRDESASIATLDDPLTEEVMKHYGPLKAACEEEVRTAFGDAAIIVRPGLIVGPYDSSDRFGYWVARFRHPKLLGDRPATAVVPAPSEAPIQLIDARDLAAWMIDLVKKNAVEKNAVEKNAGEAGAGRTYNACSSSGHWTFGKIVDALRLDAGAPQATWIDENLLLQQTVEPWTGLPLWIPTTFADEAGFMEFDCRRAQAAGLVIRPLEQTVAATADWLAVRDNEGAWKAVLTADAERKILALAAAGVPSGQ